ncbi:MAG: CPBP family intramembrane metalloprotease [Chloroflexi bacterium]|nr:CPBP family intramembrane metalloprotease [Chloroflexota bacterium]
MSAQVASLGRREITTPASGAQRLAWFVAFLMCGLAIFVFGCNYFDLFATNRNLNYQGVLGAAFLITAVWFKRDARLNRYWQIAFAFFIAAFAVMVTSLIGGWNLTILGWFNVAANGTSQFQAVNKVYEMLMIVVPIIALTKLSGADLGSIYLKRGNLKWGLSIGALVFFNFAASAFLFFAMRYTSLDKLVAAVIWGIVFSLANGFMEELWLRGIFLKRFEPVLGVGGAVLVTSIIFALMHSGAVYLTPIALPFMVANTLTLGLACGYLMMKTDSIWSAVLIHAASDLFLFIALLANA